MANPDPRVKCEECGWYGTMSQVDAVTDPNPLPGTLPTTWSVCPECRAAEQIVTVCHADGCRNTASCGEPWPDGVYRWSCYAHSKLRQEATPKQELPS